jgi:hypothetical protein
VNVTRDGQKILIGDEALTVKQTEELGRRILFLCRQARVGYGKKAGLRAPGRRGRRAEFERMINEHNCG